MQYAATTAQCPACNSVFYGCDRDEDGRPSFESLPCADAGCEVYLCHGICQELSFSCDGCGRRFCLSHLILIPDGADRPLKCCAICAAGVELAPVPIVRRLVMLAESGCSLQQVAGHINEVA